jgi:Protein of unknown function (DUF3014)
MDRPGRRRRRSVRIVIGLLAVAGALLGAIFYLRGSGIIESLPLPLPSVFGPEVAQSPAPPPPGATVTSTLYPPPGSLRDETLPGEEEAQPPPEPLPPLAESDSYAAGLVRGLSANPRLASWLANGSLVRRFVAVVDNVADGESPRPHVPFLAPEGAFKTATISGGRLVIDPRSYDRYDPVADALASIDTHGAVELYRRLRPLTDDAYRELGRNDRSFDDALRLAIRRVLAVPVVEGDVALVPRVISFGYADPRLQGLGPVEKHLVRMGPRNLHIIQEGVRAFANDLGVPAAELPATPALRASGS